MRCGTEGNKVSATGCGSAWLERLIWDQEVAGSNPVTPIDHKENCDLMSVSELEQAKLVHSERRMSITIDFEEIVKHEVRIVI